MMLSTAATPRAPQTIPAARPTRAERYHVRRARATRVVAAGLWLAVPALVALVAGLVVPLGAGAVRAEVLGAGLALLLAAGAVMVRGGVEIGRARRAYEEGRRVHAVPVGRGGAL
jgi:hypothetical protein